MDRIYSKGGDLVIECDNCHRIHIDGYDGYPICDCSRPLERMDDMTMDRLSEMRELLWVIAHTPVTQELRSRHCDMQIDADTLKAIRGHFNI